MPQLPYTMEALAPYMSRETLEYHYGKHLQTYVDNLNKLIAGTRRHLQQCRTDMEPYVLLRDAYPPANRHARQTGTETDGRLRLARGVQTRIYTESDNAVRLRMGMADRGHTRQTLHSDRAQCRQSADQRHEADSRPRCMGTCLLHWLPQPAGSLHRSILELNRLGKSCLTHHLSEIG